MRLNELFPGSTARILAVLLAAPTLPWSRSLLAAKAGVDVRTVRRALARLRALDVVQFDTQFGVLSLNVENPLVAALLGFHEAVAAYQAPKRAADA